MRIVDGRAESLLRIAYRRARRGGGTEQALLEVERVRVDELPDGCDAVVATSDLQGVTSSPFGGDPVLLGIALADHLTAWSREGLLPPPERVGVLLAGDLYSSPNADRRGATGKVADVWLAFAAAGCRWIVGVAGNHDVIEADEVTALGGTCVLLDGDWTDVGGTVVGGVGGVIGDPWRADRRGEDAFLGMLADVVESGPDLVVLHEGPAGARRDQPGNTRIGAALALLQPPLTLCGHVHWNRALSRAGTGHVLNVDDRVVVLTR